MVVEQINTVYKAVNQPLLAFLRGDVYLAEVVERKQYLLLGEHRVTHLRLEQLYFKISLALFQLVQRLLCRRRVNALCDRLHKIVQFDLHARELYLNGSCRIVLLLLQFIDAVGKFFYYLVA